VKLLHLLGDPADLGGILSVVRCLSEATSLEGDRHVVVVQTGYQEIRLPSLEYRFSTRLVAESPRHADLLIRAMPAYLEVRRLVRGESFDLVHAHTRGAFPVAVLLASVGCRAVMFTNHTYARRTRWYRLATRLRRFHTVMLTPNMARHYGVQAPSARVSIIPDCCRDLFFELPLKSRRDHRDTATPIRLVGVGNIMRWKNWHLLIDALTHLQPHEIRQLQFFHYGEAYDDGDSPAYDRWLRGKVLQAGLESTVHFCGPTLDVPARLVEADWFVLPSTNEPCSVALTEAMALGLPALVSASGGNVDLVSPGNTGWLFTPEDPVDLARQLRRILEPTTPIASPESIRASARARRATEVAQRYRDLYRHLLAGAS
jgi:glycosyltransferase involved in cell wall biosynthesis